MEQIDQIEAAAMLMGAVAVVTAAFRRMDWNPVLGLITAGIMLGPHGFALVAPTGAVSTMAELGILFLLFIIGVELSPSPKMLKSIFGLGTVHFLLSATALGGFIYFLFNENFITAAVLGVGLAMSSTAFVLQTLVDSGQMNQAAGRKSFAVLLFQDLMVAPILAVLPMAVAMAAPKAAGVMPPREISLLVASVSMMVIFVVARLLLIQLLGNIHEDEVDASKDDRSSYFLAAIISVALLMGVAAHHLGLSASLGAFLAGLALSGGEYRHDIKKQINPLKSTFLAVFFVSLGAQLPLAASPKDMALMVAAALGIITLKVGAGFAAGFFNGMSRTDSLRLGLILAQAGEFAFIVVAQAGHGAMPAATAHFWTGAAVVSLVATPLLVSFAARLDSSRRQPPSGVAEPPQAGLTTMNASVSTVSEAGSGA